MKTLLLKIFLTISLLIIVKTNAVQGQAFVDKGYSAKITSLGRAAVSLSDDPSLVFYNPAGIGFSHSLKLFTSYTNLYPNVTDANLNFFSLAGEYPLSNLGVIGIGVTQFAPTGWSENMAVGTFARQFFDERLSFGGSVKVLRWSSAAPQGEYAVPENGLSYLGFSFDVGVLYSFRDVFKDNDIQIGASVLNFTQPSVASNGSPDAKLPAEMNFGASYVSRVYDYSVTTGITVKGNDVRVCGGAEFVGLRTTVLGSNAEFLVRAGGGRLTAADSQGEYDAGFGLIIGNVAIDYSFSYQAMVGNVGGISSLSLGYAFN